MHSDILANNFRPALQDGAVKKAYDLIIKMAKVGFEKGSQPHEKFNTYLQAAGFSSLDKQKFPYVDVDLLVNLRNAYIHYKPKWRVTLQDNLFVNEVAIPRLKS